MGLAQTMMTARFARVSGSRPYYGWVVVAALGVTTVVSYAGTLYLFGVLVVPMQRELGWTRGEISGAYALASILAGLLGVPVGRLVDRVGARAPMSVGSVLTGALLIGLSRVDQLWQFYALWSGGLGIATALVLYPVSFTVVANWFERRRGMALAVLTLVGGLASPIGIPLAGWLVAHVGWRGTVTALGAAQLAIALPLHALLLRRHPEDLGLLPDGGTPARTGGPTIAAGSSLRRALRTLAFWTLTASAALTLLGSTAVTTHQVAAIIGGGYGGVLAATLAGLVGLASLPGRFVMNAVSDRLGPQRLLAACYAVQGLGVVILAGARSLPWLVAYVLVYGAAFGAVSPLRASVMADQFGRKAYGAIFAAQGVPVALCAGGGPLLAGWLYDVYGSYGLAFELAAAAFFLGSLGVVVTPAPRALERGEDGGATTAQTS